MTNSWVKLFTGRKEMSQESQEKIAILQVSEKMSKTIFFFCPPDAGRKGKCINKNYKSRIPNFLLSRIPVLP